MRKTLKKLLAGAFLGAVVLTSVFGATGHKTYAATTRDDGCIVYEDSYAKAVSNPALGCGYIEAKEDKEINNLNEIEDTSLRNIMTFINGGCVTKYKRVNHPSNYFEYEMVLNGYGPTGFLTRGIVTFYDMTGDYYEVSLYDSSYKEHSVLFNSDIPTIVKVTWESDVY